MNRELSKQEMWLEYYSHRATAPVPFPDVAANRFDFEIDRLLHRHLPLDRPFRVIEMGCGDSPWLPYLAAKFGYEVAGVDYLEYACQMARERLACAGARGQIMQRDFRSAPNAEDVHSYDLVLSLGVIEHFSDPASIVGQFDRYLREGGLMITSVPYLRGFQGCLMRVFAPKIYQTHKTFGLQELIRFHQAQGLEIRHAGYLLCPLNLSWALQVPQLPKLIRPLARKVANLWERVTLWVTKRYDLNLQVAMLASAMVVVASKPAMCARHSRTESGNR